MAEVRTRKSAGERRAELVEVALRHFAERGYVAASTDAIAAETGISQPYLFRLFGTKRELFLACHEVAQQRIHDTFRAAAQGATPEERLGKMGMAYVELLADRHRLQFQMQCYAACTDDAIRERVRAGYGELVREVRAMSGAPEDEVWRFFATGMLLNVVAALGLEEIADGDDWAAAWCAPGDLAGFAGVDPDQRVPPPA
jgi:AcrR family transcriptional regulator